ncbi:MAG: hypothetical protein O7G88_05380 [bacterium]|nr:hypothetical protein [bacterium]
MESAWAIIENPATNAQRLYRLNQVVAGMARLAWIEQDRIELARGENEKTLEVVMVQRGEGPLMDLGTAK